MKEQIGTQIFGNKDDDSRKIRKTQCEIYLKIAEDPQFNQDSEMKHSNDVYRLLF